MKFLGGLISPWILVVLKSPTVKTEFLDFLQIQAIFRKTNYIMFSYLLIATSGQTVSKKKIFDCGHEISILHGIYRHLLLNDHMPLNYCYLGSFLCPGDSKTETHTKLIILLKDLW